MKKIQVSPEEQLAEIKLGAVDIIPEEHFLHSLKQSYDEQRPLNIKLGADPNRPDIHLGHSVILHKLKKFQDFGHQVYFLIGDFTALIGDPTGKNKARTPLSEEDVIKNAQSYKEQIGKILDLDKVKVVYNSAWLKKLSPIAMIELMAKCTVQNIIRREDFAQRIKGEVPIHMHEFLYPILQGYDSVALEADVELGGTDQTFNLLMGRDLQKAYHCKRQQSIITYPLLEGLDGVKKMSKSENNYISVNESAENIFGKLMSISDEMMPKYYQLLCRRPYLETQAIIEQIQKGQIHPMDAKKNLAAEITSYYFGASIAQDEKNKFETRFSKKETPQDLPTYHRHIKDKSVSLIDLAIEAEFAKTNSEVRRLIKQNAVKINNQTYNDELLHFESKQEYIIRYGKLKILKLIIK